MWRAVLRREGEARVIGRGSEGWSRCGSLFLFTQLVREIVELKINWVLDVGNVGGEKKRAL